MDSNYESRDEELVKSIQAYEVEAQLKQKQTEEREEQEALDAPRGNQDQQENNERIPGKEEGQGEKDQDRSQGLNQQHQDSSPQMKNSSGMKQSQKLKPPTPKAPIEEDKHQSAQQNVTEQEPYESKPYIQEQSAVYAHPEAQGQVQLQTSTEHIPHMHQQSHPRHTPSQSSLHAPPLIPSPSPSPPSSPALVQSLIPSLDIRSQLLLTRQKYQRLLSSKEMLESQRRLIMEMVRNIDVQLGELEGREEHTDRQAAGREERRAETRRKGNQDRTDWDRGYALEVLFDYYCKQSYATGKNPTFDRIQYETNILNVNKFMVFCKDFELLHTGAKSDESGYDYPKMAELVEIFKKHSENYKDMNFEQYKRALEKIAEKMAKGKEEKWPMLWKLLSMETESSFRNKTKQLKIPYLPKDEIKKPVPKPAGYKLNFLVHADKLKTQKTTGKQTSQSNRATHLRNQNISNRINQPQQLQLKPLKLPSAIPKPRQQPLSRPPMLPLPKRPSNHQQPPPTKVNLSTKVIRHPQASPSGGHRVLSQNTGYSQIHGKKRGVTIATSGRDFKLNDVVEAARNIVRTRGIVVGTADRRREQQELQREQQEQEEQEEPKGALGNIIGDQEDDAEDQYLMKHWQMEKQMSQDALNLRINDKIQQLRRADKYRQRNNTSLHEKRRVIDADRYNPHKL